MGVPDDRRDFAPAATPGEGSVVGRLAPSPTGRLHIGNARTFLVAWWSARLTGGRVVLRIEDLDPDRCSPELTAAVIVDLEWLGLDWDEGPDVGGPRSPYLQSRRTPLYRAALERLIAADLVYPCTCSRRDLAAAATAPHAGAEGPPYPGTCAARRAADGASLAVPFAWRFRADAATPSGRTEAFDDLLTGPDRLDIAASLGDFVVWRRDDVPAYQLAVVVDDLAMGVTEVVRGEDLRTSTFRQLGLYRALGADPPRFAHLPLMTDPAGRKLSKRDDDAALTALRRRGRDGRAVAEDVLATLGPPNRSSRERFWRDLRAVVRPAG